MTSEMLSHLAHAGLALAAQIVVAVAAALCGASLPAAACLGALFSVGFYWGREVAQVERSGDLIELAASEGLDDVALQSPLLVMIRDDSPAFEVAP